MAEKRERWIACILYPESADPHWQDYLKQLMCAVYISPLHEYDLNADGTKKKDHWHLLIDIDTLKSQDQIRSILDRIGATKELDIVSKIGYARYLCHLDNPEKHQYNISDVMVLGPGDYIELINRTVDLVNDMMAIEEYIDSNHIHSYKSLCFMLRTTDKRLYRVVCSHTIHFLGYLKSSTWVDKQSDLPLDIDEKLYG